MRVYSVPGMGQTKSVRRRARKTGERVEVKFRFSPEVAAALSKVADAEGKSVSLLGEEMISGVLEAVELGSERVSMFLALMVHEARGRRQGAAELMENYKRRSGEGRS
jgi:hypothetical protein